MTDLETTADRGNRSFLKRLFDRVMVLSAGPHALWLLAVVSFAEASFFPIPPDPVLAAIVLARRDRWLSAALVCTIASVLGGLAGYAIGAGLYEVIGQPVIAFYHLEEAFHNFQLRFDEWGGWIIVAKGLTPIPFKLVTIASGVVHLNLVTFIVAAALTRGLRFFIVAWLFYRFGPQARAMIDEHFTKVMIGGTILVILGFVAIIYI
ncbi:membrane protein YqaA, SNARE-associated domain [Kaistia soli DSM 19436]|uniref:Membrane protein YqaA, SNARE-associated domain n=1 Tax=Kaistia soli DSM 19436 TaxID=1122133 RepID=A0A1M5MKV1_9HYPH|nr:YqaA family protein [Kaistia soli]SHG78064.1 membrane protein YqaA, SNARE-associated domain [Kaistia soli DSM 19436]